MFDDMPTITIKEAQLRCTFEPQFWGGPKDDYAYPANPEGETTWIMDMIEVKELTGCADTENLDDDPFSRDELRHSRNAPQWVKDWSGPFEVSWELVQAADEENATKEINMNETTSARSYMSFNLNMMLLMLNCGRTDEANRALAKLLDALDQIPEDLNITVNKEIDNA